MNIFSDPKKIVQQLDIFPGQHVADLGCGSGAYTIALAEKMKGSHKSRVFAVDVQKNLLVRIDAEARLKKIDSVHIIWGNIEEEKGTHLRDDSLNLVLVANTLFQVENKEGLLKEAYRILKPEGRLVVIDWSESFGNIGPRSEYVINEKTTRLLCETHGFVIDSLSLKAGEHHYGFIMRKI